MNKDITAKEMQKRGVKTFQERYGMDKYKEMGKKAHQAKVDKYGPDYGLKLALKGLEGRFKSGNMTQESYERAKAKIEAKLENLE